MALPPFLWTVTDGAAQNEAAPSVTSADTGPGPGVTVITTSGGTTYAVQEMSDAAAALGVAFAGMEQAGVNAAVATAGLADPLAQAQEALAQIAGTLGLPIDTTPAQATKPTRDDGVARIIRRAVIEVEHRPHHRGIGYQYPMIWRLLPGGKRTELSCDMPIRMAARFLFCYRGQRLSFVTHARNRRGGLVLINERLVLVRYAHALVRRVRRPPELEYLMREMGIRTGRTVEFDEDVPVRGGREDRRRIHDPDHAGSTPAPATK